MEYGYSKEDVVKILMRRDGLSEREARLTVVETQAEIDHAIKRGCGLDEIENIIADELGLEPDYLMDFLF